MTYPYFQRTTHAMGPASQVFYDSGITLADPDMTCQPGLRLQLSKAVSHLYFLHPHALILSQIESKPLSCYYSPKLYEKAQLLYFGGSSPGQDLLRCMQAVDLLRT
jgi:hypothetical protein